MQLTTLINENWLPLITGICATAGLGSFLHFVLMKNTHALYRQKFDAQEKLNQNNHTQLTLANNALQQELRSLTKQKESLTDELRMQFAKLAAISEKLRQFDRVNTERQELAQKLETLREQKANLTLKFGELQARTDEQLEAAEQKIQLLENAEERLRIQFESLANRVFEQKTKTVDEQNRQSLSSLLSPLKSELEGFRKQVSDSFGEQAKERHTLIHEINNLQKLNETMTREAVNLTQALKGDNKQQGNWGEVVLSRVLEESGLREGHEYQTQVSLTNEQGKRFQPDVIVRLPQGKDIVIDAKMVLVAYERYFNADSLAEKESALNDHILALRNHIRGLGRKDYHQLHGIETLDYVLMFIPIEPAFQIAIEAEPALVREALDNNIMLVSPTTLLVALRTINNLWRYEHQNQNSRLIAEKAAKLYDKIRLFVTDMEAVGGAIEKAGESYQGAINKLATGRGNILRQAESFKSLGVEVKKDISPNLVEKDIAEEGLPSSSLPSSVS